MLTVLREMAEAAVEVERRSWPDFVLRWWTRAGERAAARRRCSRSWPTPAWSTPAGSVWWCWSRPCCRRGWELPKWGPPSRRRWRLRDSRGVARSRAGRGGDLSLHVLHQLPRFGGVVRSCGLRGGACPAWATASWSWAGVGAPRCTSTPTTRGSCSGWRPSAVSSRTSRSTTCAADQAKERSRRLCRYAIAAPGTLDPGGGCRRGRGQSPALPKPGGLCSGRRRPVDEPVGRGAAGGGPRHRRSRGGHPAQQQEHHPGGRAGGRAHRPGGPRRPHPLAAGGAGCARGFRSHAPWGRERGAHGGGHSSAQHRRGHPGGTGLDGRRARDPAGGVHRPGRGGGRGRFAGPGPSARDRWPSVSSTRRRSS